MEENGIGRPSTYAPTISTVQSRNYIEKKTKELSSLIESWGPQFLNIERLAELENFIWAMATRFFKEIEWHEIVIYKENKNKSERKEVARIMVEQ